MKKIKQFLHEAFYGLTDIKIIDVPVDFIWSVYNSFLSKKEQLGRMIFWSKAMRKSYDFDAGTIYEMLHHKLDRLYNCFKNEGHCVWNSDTSNNPMRKLNEARSLAKRLSEDKYTIRAFSEAEEKFGYKFRFDKSDEGSLVKGGFTNNPKRAELFYKGRDKVYRKQREYEKKRLFYLLENYIDQLWD